MTNSQERGVEAWGESFTPEQSLDLFECVHFIGAIERITDEVVGQEARIIAAIRITRQCIGDVAAWDRAIKDHYTTFTDAAQAMSFLLKDSRDLLLINEVKAFINWIENK